MLDFFVLGEVPGTNMVITFTWVLIMAAIVLGFGEASILYNRYKMTLATAKPATKSKAKTKSKK